MAKKRFSFCKYVFDSFSFENFFLRIYFKLLSKRVALNMQYTSNMLLLYEQSYAIAILNEGQVVGLKNFWFLRKKK